ncbi:MULTISPECIES: ABC-F family ATP-binding cassette domain-containing protein [Pseudobutyrivibrio]|jgi:ATPase subunit of ABC transporter with duplicated ATPase domains|uniref:ABC transporter ATP-binding protein n=2 Tax=Pseudobutyrivibrio TaxID=46205 RepID=A0A2G3DYJ8_9FIRM|nr:MULTISPECIES: ATP-binding cassette domain-containing protein [Pseudobutyrivibrio]MBE5903256.1 ATP-binding cassette domain-containing protein [Pseudobutyrivibrio sp.]MBP5324003.1 ATP-binding cassette domain-containing protein [Pseudobutyrivibrio sp.]MBQ7469122.1 ATP-binding cassette domain-containing protein [Pseudobutyrivibrio sp.]MBR5649802.1 ATP-binding cassette domain-containing protein [Pseudobutyrivibrio sp.]NEX00622.1 ATP-binding cassette domain-containing protein [Pseudobutyrivibrio 
MIQANNVTLRFGKKALFEEVNIKFTEGNCYGIIGANGAGKSTFLKILSGQLEPTSGEITMSPGNRLSFLEQDHFKYDEFTALDTVIMGNQRLYDIMKEKDAIYMKEDFSDEDGIRAAELETEFAEMDGWNAESDAATLLNGLGVDTEFHYTLMSELPGALKVKILLARALFGSPDVLLLDEPTNHLDLDAIGWLEEFLINFENTVIVVSHDRYFLNKVCTHTADIDYGKIQLYAGNYDFWYQSSQLIIQQRKEANKKKEEQIKELQEFIQRFSANASKSKQATSRKRALEKIQLDDIRPSSRKYPYIDFRPAREIGNEVLSVENLTKTIDGELILDHLSFNVGREDKIAFVGSNEKAKTVLFQILAGEMEPDEGSYKWGVTTSQSYFPKDNTEIFSTDLLIVDWLTQFSEIKDATYVRGFLGRMLFAGDDGAKKMKVLSGGEKVRVLLSRMMIENSNVLMLDEPTDHLDMESITALNTGLQKFSGVILFSSRDHEIVQTTANRIIEILPNGQMIDKMTTYDEYLESDEMARKRAVLELSDDELNDD